MKNQKGITLIALVVTIVVLLILAGTAIAMLQGENGIITQAQNANYANTEGEIFDKVRLAYSDASTEVRVESALTLGYNATTETNLIALANIISKDLGGTGTTIKTGTLTETIGKYTITVTTTSTPKIEITYDDGSVFTGDKARDFVINVSATSLTLNEPDRLY